MGILHFPHLWWTHAGLPTFIIQPEDQNVTKSAPFTLTCEAVGPPDPVQIRWLRDGLPNSDYHDSPSSFSVSGELGDHLITVISILYDVAVGTPLIAMVIYVMVRVTVLCFPV